MKENRIETDLDSADGNPIAAFFFGPLYSQFRKILIKSEPAACLLCLYAYHPSLLFGDLTFYEISSQQMTGYSGEVHRYRLSLPGPQAHKPCQQHGKAAGSQGCRDQPCRPESRERHDGNWL